MSSSGTGMKIFGKTVSSEFKASAELNWKDILRNYWSKADAPRFISKTWFKFGPLVRQSQERIR